MVKSANEAENIGVQALAWLAEDSDLLGRFLGTSGAALEDIRVQARDPAFLGFVLDFLLSEDAMIVAFADEINVRPEAVARARMHLPGGDGPHWS